MPLMTIWDAYETYRIMPNLRLHQMRVAALARELAIALNADHELVTQVGLLHDMGNILKSDFSQFPPEFYGEKGVEYWEGVKREYAATYGTDEHAATETIAREIGVPSNVIDMINSMGFSKMPAILETGSRELQVIQYADLRVGPHGVTSLEERMNEGRARYVARSRAEFGENEAMFQTYRDVARTIEARLFEGLLIAPGMLTEESLTPVIESLREYVII